MPATFDALPGIEVPVGSISKGLASMWEVNAAEGRPSPASEYSKAIQVNLVLHLGLNTTSEDAAEQFQTAVRLSRHYPSRVVVLCPLGEDAGVTDIRAKVYGECTLGKTPGDTRCCEFVMLSYPRVARGFLESQVSVCLSTDLPLYYWAHRFSEAAKLADYRYLLTTARRVLIDSATAPADALDYKWPNPGAVRDLAFARLLPVRQSIGQFLGRYPVQALSSGFASLRLAHGPGIAAEARSLFAWMKDRLGASGVASPSGVLEARGDLGAKCLELGLSYEGKKSFTWKADVSTCHAVFDADFGWGRTVMPATVFLLAQENALSEAMFF
jgi:glucose-6-phosphate dehydrogenase assembly protein OpcA